MLLTGVGAGSWPHICALPVAVKFLLCLKRLPQRGVVPLCCSAALLLLLWPGGRKSYAQTPVQDTANTTTLRIVSSREGTMYQTDTGSIFRNVGDVILQQGTTTLYCDSALFNITANNLEAFGAVRIVQTGGTQVESDYLRYTGNTRRAYLRGGVALTNGADNLWSEVLTYNVGTKLGTYSEGGTLQSEETVLSSAAGTYNGYSKDARFRGDVTIHNPRYDVVSDDLGYNTSSKIVRFLGPSVVTNDSSELRTTGGTYDERREVARFTTRSSIWSSAQYVEADSMDYDRATGFGLARGGVYALDTAQRMQMWGGYGAVNEKGRTLLVAIKPVMARNNGDDTLFMAADTFFSAPQGLEWGTPGTRAVAAGKPLKPATDSSATTTRSRRGRRGPGTTTQADSTRQSTPRSTAGEPDSTQDSSAGRTSPMANPNMSDAGTADPQSAIRNPPPNRGDNNPESDSVNSEFGIRNPEGLGEASSEFRYFIGWNHVRVFSDSLQAVCDSVRYTASDSALRLIRDPVAWARASQITGDTLVLFTDSSRLRRLFVPAAAFLLSRSGPEKAGLWDQIQGETMTGYFENNELSHLIVYPDARTIYWATDNGGAYIGVNEAQSERMRVFFREGAIRRILFETDVTQKATPMDQAPIPNMRLERFRNREEERPKSKAEIFGQ